MMTIEDKLARAAELIKNSRHTTVFTGAGISVESGIPPFRGEGGLWSKYDPELLDIAYFCSHPDESWSLIKEIFYDFFGQAEPNAAHIGIAELEKMGLAKAVITQNVDNLHQAAGSRKVLEFHGTSKTLTCLICKTPYEVKDVSLEKLPPRCPKCMGIMKPDFVFFGEGIPRETSFPSFHEAEMADVFLVIGTTGEVMPACQIPFRAKERGAKLIEINPEPSNFTYAADVFLKGKAGELMTRLVETIKAL